MMRKVVALVPLFFGLASVAAFADAGERGGQTGSTGTENLPEVLEIRIPVDASGADMGGRAEIRALDFDDGLPLAADGNVDMDKINKAAQESSGASLTIESSSMTADGAPDAVKEVFDHASASDSDRMIFWSFYRPWLNWGLWGYGYSPYYSYYYPGYFPRYGLYYGDRLYNYYPSWRHYRYGGYRSHYYWRW